MTLEATPAWDVDTSGIQKQLKEMISQVTGAAAAEISGSLNLFTLGLDSLMLVQLGKNIRKSFGVDIPIKTFFAELHTVELLANYILKNHTVAVPAYQVPVKVESNSNSDDVQQIINRQLTIMEEQLRLLNGVVVPDKKKMLQARRLLVSLAPGASSSRRIH